MFLRRKLLGNQGKDSKSQQKTISEQLIEALEDRRLLSVTVVHHNLHAHKAHHTAKHASKRHASSTSASTTGSSTTSAATTATTIETDWSTYQGHGKLINSIEFDLAPASVQTGLNSLASTDGLTAPATTQIVQLGNSNGVETYSIEYTTSGTQSRLTVDQNGNPITAPTRSTITWADLTGSGSNANAAAAAEITAIATAQSLTAPTATTVVDTSTTSSGTTYSVHLAPSSTSTGEYEHDQNISVDSNGNPVGNQSLPFSVLPTAIQGFINANLPTGATALASTSTQSVDVHTIDGVVTYSTTFTVSGTASTVTVDLAGTLETLTDPTTTTFSLIPALAQTELQSLATAEGVTTAIASTQNVNVYTELNGTIVYAVTLSATDSTTSQTYEITVASDALGNPTVPPGRGFGGGFGGGCGGFGGHDDDGGPGGFSDPDGGFSGFARFGG